jgi:hypothetical protein
MTEPHDVDDMSTMHVDAFIADAAATAEGKISALGMGWNVIYANTFPATHSHLSIAMTIHVPYTQTNQPHQVLVHLETADAVKVKLGDSRSSPDAEAEDITVIGGEFSVGRPPALPAGDEQIVPLALSVDSLRFENPGMYSWVISIDGKQMRRLPMRVALLNQLGPR